MTIYTNEQMIYTLVEGFKNKTLPKTAWTHEAHLTVAFWFLFHNELATATCLIRSGIITYNQATDTPNDAQKGYHETLTLFWIKTIANYLQEHRQGKDLLKICNQFLQTPEASRQYPMQFYEPTLLFSTHARAFWVAPTILGTHFEI